MFSTIKKASQCVRVCVCVCVCVCVWELVRDAVMHISEVKNSRRLLKGWKQDGLNLQHKNIIWWINIAGLNCNSLCWMPFLLWFLTDMKNEISAFWLNSVFLFGSHCLHYNDLPATVHTHWQHKQETKQLGVIYFTWVLWDKQIRRVE